MTGHAPLVTVYIPTKNRAALVSEAVASVLAQTYRNLEVIVAIDGATDDTEQVLARISEHDPRLRVIVFTDSQGAPRARNAAIRAAQGQFVTGLDDDDQFMPHRIEAFVNTWQFMESHGQPLPPFLYAQDVFFDGHHSRSSTKPTGVTLERLCECNLIGNQVFAPKARIDAVGGFDEALPAWQDIDLWMRLVKAFGPGTLVDLPTQRFNDDDRPDRITKANRAKIKTACHIVLAKHPELPAYRRQQIFAQFMGAYYGFRIGWPEFSAYFRLGFSLGACMRLYFLMKDRRWALSGR